MKDITRRGALKGGSAMLPAAWLGSSTNVTLAKLFEIPPEDDVKDADFWRLVRELIARCKDFARLEAIYDRSKPARAYYYDAYQGIVVTAKCIHWIEKRDFREEEILRWVSSIYPDDFAWVLRREPPINGLSRDFVKLNLAFEEALRGLAAWSA